MDNVQQTYLMIKPDGVKRSLVGEIISRLEKSGLKIVYTRMILATEDQARGNYPGTDEWMSGMGEKSRRGYDGDLEKMEKEMGTSDTLEAGKKIYEQLVTYLVSGPMIGIVVEGNHAVEVAQKLVGKTIPAEADLGSIRGDYGFDSPMLAVRSGRITFQNLIHVSDSEEEAGREIKYWLGNDFKPMRYERTDHVGYGIKF